MNQPDDIRKLLSHPNSLIVMYVGNLETYQGIDLLINSFSLAAKATDQADLVIIGGQETDIQSYSNLSKQLAISHRVHFLGPRPVEDLSKYLAQADILVSPRIKGKNTPMKIYSYLGSGKAVLATSLETHTQVLTDQISVLAEPVPEPFSQGLLTLIQDAELRRALGTAGRELIQANYSFSAFRSRVNNLLDWVQVQIDPESAAAVRTRS